MEPSVLRGDMQMIFDNLSEFDKSALNQSVIFVTGFAGSLGYPLLHFFQHYGHELGISKVMGMDNFVFGRPKWVDRLMEHPLFDLKEGNVVSDDLEFAAEADYIMHMASMASPVFYRKHPIETMDADVIGLRRLLELYRSRGIRGFLFYSSSEVYGDPPDIHIPTPESYWGNVNSCGPRACYDESKRFGETLCYNFARKYGMPITVVRPFNNFGPGLRINDQRVVADFAGAVINDRDIIVYSNGSPTRTFAYSADATIGYIKCLVHGRFDVFNIGSDNPELTVRELAGLYVSLGKELCGYSGEVVYAEHLDSEYLTDNPQRRCPNIDKAKKKLSYVPHISVEDGIKRYLYYLMQSEVSEFIW
jgi:UDP-glucuronate decarboxylase